MSSFPDLEDKHKKEQKKIKEIDIREIFIVLKRYIWIIIMITFITTSLGTYYTISTFTPLYQSTNRIIFGPAADINLITTLKVIIKDTTVLDKVVSKLDLPYTSEILAGKIAVGTIDNSSVVTITITDKDPEQAALIANVVAETYKEEIPKIMGFNDVKPLSEAKVNHTPINQSQNRNIVISILGGIVIGVGLAFLLESLNNSVRKEDEVEELLGIPVLGSVSTMKKKNMQNKRKNDKLMYRGETLGS